MTNDNRADVFPTGPEEIEQVTDGFRGGQLTLLAGRPAIGKTGLVIRVLDNMCVHSGKSAFVFSSHVSPYEYMHRLISEESGVSMEQLRDFALSESELYKVKESAERINRAHISMSYSISSTLRVSDIRNYLQDFLRKPILLIDDLEQMRSERSAGRLYDDTLRELKSLAEEHDIPIIVTANLSRACERRKDHRPRISDIRHVRDASVIDTVLLLHSDSYYAADGGSRLDDLEMIVEIRR